MPDLWAVKIESEVEAMELQALFPDAECNFDSFLHAFKEGFTYFKTDIIISPSSWFWLDTNPSKKYTIYTIEQLKELLK
jgi:hypothetical protein